MVVDIGPADHPCFHQELHDPLRFQPGVWKHRMTYHFLLPLVEQRLLVEPEEVIRGGSGRRHLGTDSTMSLSLLSIVAHDDDPCCLGSAYHDGCRTHTTHGN